jgi:hypothetical protein
VEVGTVRWRRGRGIMPVGSVRVASDQPLVELAAILLEAQSPDSFLQWGFLLGILQKTEYLEAYVLEPLARDMLAADPALQREWEAALAADPELRADPEARLRFFGDRSAYHDSRYRVYPIGRELAVDPGAAATRP